MMMMMMTHFHPPHLPALSYRSPRRRFPLIPSDADKGGDGSFSLLRVASCMVAVSAAAGFAIVAAVTLGLTLRRTRCRCCKQSESLELDGKNEGDYASLQQPEGDFYQTASMVNRPHVGALGRKSKKAFLETAEETEDIYENL